MITFGRRLVAVVATALLLSVVGAAPVAAQASGWSHRDAQVCGQPGAGQARCASIARTFYLDGRAYQARTEAELAHAAAATQTSWFHGPDLRTAYGITANGDPSKVVAIVDAYDDPNAYSNLTRFRGDQGLATMPSCTLAQLTARTSTDTPCFTKVNQTGGTALPPANAGWSNEIDLDLQAASSICPTCSILLLEATSASLGNLATAVTTASGIAHVLAISNSYGISGDYPGSLAPAYDNAAKTGRAVTASAGDGGYGVLFPASATNVIGVGGTTLYVSGSTGARTSETVWSGTGSGCSIYNAAPAWQSVPGNPCAGKKAVSDLSADADPNSGLAIYTTYSGITGYWVFGGTSLSSPLIAALYTMQGGYNASTLAGQYAWAAGTPYYDVTSGSNGTCSPSLLCTAVTGWDGPTGRGSIAVASAPPVLTTITVSPASASVQTNGTQQFTAAGYDQYGKPYSLASVGWSVSGGGTISGSGLFTAGPTAGGPFTVTASSGGVNGTASVTVTTVTPDFSLSVTPAKQSIRRGGTATYTVTITPSNGFSGSVSLSLTGQPSGATVSWSANPSSGTSTLTIITLRSTARRTYSLTITGVSGTLTHSASAQLSVTK